MRNLFCTADTIGTETGGGVVTRNEAEALRGIGDVIPLDASLINPAAYKLPNSPYVQDYLADALVLQLLAEKIDLAHFYSGMFAKTINRLKNAGTKVTQTIAAHDVQLSSEEFAKYGIPFDFPHLTQRTLWLPYIEGQTLADKVICPSRASAEIVKSYGVKDPVVIPHGINMPDPRDLTAPPEVFTVGYLGQCGPDKGLRYLLEAWSMLNLTGCKLLMAGNGIEQMAPVWQATGGKGEVQFLGYVKDVDELYNNISVYVQPSVTEGFGIEVLEAMAHGRPVIVSEGAGAADVVRHCTDGYVVPRRDPDAIADCIQILKNDPALAASMGAQARERAMQYTWDKILPQYQALWKTLTGSGVKLKEPAKAKCYACFGLGVCPSCKGRASVCDVCHGAGVCPDCKGEGVC